ncbi:hypothetical protein GC093_19085 [Paenibacillus sp. LMG 31456]|uniref:Uncharacterized protein n=1 Tax=Paenibacillus foliorum TaxID=2654974 RepID=A0A972GW72_9BACL|nr:hypothetical protein [Paenibacillus foliorum]NOU95313.1 hypothetical protein [Paenibacillus foliorum]
MAVRYLKKTEDCFRITDLVVGRKYKVVQPSLLNSKSLKNLDRECIILDFIMDRNGYYNKAKIKYLDNKRVGQISFGNLANEVSQIRCGDHTVTNEVNAEVNHNHLI